MHPESIYLERPKNRREDFYQKELIEIKRKLDDKGIISRDIERKKTMTIERLLKNSENAILKFFGDMKS